MILVRAAGTPGRIAVVINPAIEQYQESPATPDWISIGYVFVASETDESQEIELGVGESSGMFVGGPDAGYRFTLMSIEHQVIDGQQFPAYNLYVEKFTEIDWFDLLLERTIASKVENDRLIAAETLIKKGALLGNRGDIAAAVQVLGEVVSLYGPEPGPAFRFPVIRALHLKAVGLQKLDRLDEERAVYDDILARTADATDSDLLEFRAKALFQKAFSFGRSRRHQDAVQGFELLIAEFGDSTDRRVTDGIASGHLHLAHQLALLGRKEDSLAMCDTILARYSDGPEHLSSIIEKTRRLREHLLR